jgi:CheY-like chemotaxis protein
MDRRMPVMDGIAANRRIRQMPEGDRVKIVAVTASVFEEQQPELLEAGMDDTIRKPFMINTIYDCLAQQLGIKYRYKSTSPKKSLPPKLTSGMFNGVDRTLRKQLHEALVTLDAERITTAIKLIGKDNSRLSEALVSLADNFEYQIIMQALESIADQQKKS